MRTWDTVAIIGVGLIGGSIGLALRRRQMAGRIVGIGRREASLTEAYRVGALTESTTDLEAGVAEARLIIVCTPIDAIVDKVRQAANRCPPGTLITDAGSTKLHVVEQLESGLPNGVRFVGSHPLAGSERSGPADARAELFDGRVVVVTPTGRTRAADVAELTDLWNGFGASVVTMGPEEHDRALAGTSHLPHAIAAVLASAQDTEHVHLAAGGLRDSTRIAGGDPELWAQILLDNRDNVLAALVGFERSLDNFRAALEAGDRERLHEFLTQAKRKRDALGS